MHVDDVKLLTMGTEGTDCCLTLRRGGDTFDVTLRRIRPTEDVLVRHLRMRVVCAHVIYV